MVFESLVVDLINKYLGDYVENLDKSQLKLGIWGGDVVLNELDVKESALDDLDLPVKVKAGHLGKLTLKIPWKNIYTEPVVASIDGLYVLAVPNVGIQYNAEKEEKAAQDGKQKKLQNLEEAKKLEETKDKPQEKKKDSFAEKFATQVIKNLQVEVRNIHVRYEDRYTNAQTPFSIGVTLKELLFRTTDENWKPCIIKEAVSQIFKLVKLESLAVYWNSSTKMYDEMDKTEILTCLKAEVEDPRSSGFQYLIKPISSVAHLRLNTKPGETEYKVPKIFLTVVFDDISVSLAKLQYNDVLEMLEGFERVSLMGIYRKYKPSVPVKGNLRTWWHFAYNSILEETVRRRRRMWSWSHIQKHSSTKKRYRTAYVKKLDQKKISSDIQKDIEECEKYLDVFNLTILRQQAEMEAAKLGAQRAQDKKDGGWFGGLFGGKKGKGKEKEADIQEQFYEQFTADEKKKLYDAIGYQENESDLTLPKEFVAVRLVVKLNDLSVTLKDDVKKDPQILKLKLKNVFASVGQRPAASAVAVEAKMDKFTVLGTQQEDYVPNMVTSVTSTGTTVLSLLDAQFETNPLDGSCDTKLRVNTRPVQIVYDAVTVNQLAEFFTPPKDIQLKQLSQAAMSKYEDIKEQSSTGLQYAIEQKKFTDIAIDLKSSYVIVPHGGILKKSVSKLVLDLGNLRVETKRNQSPSEVGQMESLEEVMKKAYDTFNVDLDMIQLLMAQPGEDWQAARSCGTSPLHILDPLSIHIVLQKCMFDKDPRMPKMKVSGQLPLVSLTISDHRLHQVLSLAQSIPLPESAPAEPDNQDFSKGPSTLPIPTATGNEARLAQKAQNIVGEVKKEEQSEYVNLTDLELDFVIKEIAVKVNKRVMDEEVPLLKLVVDSVGMGMKMRTFDMQVEAYLGGVYLQYLKIKVSDSLSSQLQDRHFITATESGPLINLVNTPVTDNKDFKLLQASYLQAKPDGPEFASVYKKTEQTIKVEFSSLELLLHLEAILGVLDFVNTLQLPSSAGPAAVSDGATTQPGMTGKGTDAETDKAVKTGPKKKKPKDTDYINMDLQASLNTLSITICSEVKMITDIRIKGIKAGVRLQDDRTTVTTVLKDMAILDPCVQSFYPKIVTIEGSEVLKFDMMLFNNNTEGENYSNMSCVDMTVALSLGRIRVYFLNKFVMDVLGFANNFQMAQAKLKEAGDAMAEYSKDAVQSLQEKASRLSLNIHLSAPLIIIPQNSVSYSVLMVDLGQLQITNLFELAEKTSSSGVPAVLDKMEITLTDVKMSRGILDASGSVKGECEILEPATVSLNLNRNLSASWFHDVPDIDVCGTLEAIKVKMSFGDFSTSMKVLNENLSEGQMPAAPDTTAVAKPTSNTGDAQTGEAIKPVVAATTESSGRRDITPAAGKGVNPHCTLKFRFHIKSLSAIMYFGESNLTSGVGLRDVDKALSHVELQLIALEGHMMSDSETDVSLLLRDMVLEDLRKEKRDGIIRMIERSKKPRTVPGDQRANMLDVSFKQQQDDKDIKIYMSSLNLCVSLDFLMTLGDFFTKALPQNPVPAVPVKETVKDVKPKGPAPPPVGTMTVLVTIDRPEIILVEDQMKTDSTALILDMELLFRMRASPETQDMSASISGLEIMSTKFDSRQKGAQIMAPCDISFYSKTPQGQGAHMDLSTTDLIFNISPATIRTMSAIAGSMSQKGDVEEIEDKIPENLWEIQKLSTCDFWFLKTAEGTGVDDPTAALEEQLVARGEQLILKVPSVVVKIEGGVGHRTVPLLMTEACFEGEVRDWSGRLQVESTLKLEVAYFNEKLSVWEPILEPVQDEKKGYRRWELQLEVMSHDLAEGAGLDDDDETDTIPSIPPKMSVNIKSTDSLQVTMTKGCLEMLSNLGKSFGDAYKLVEPTTKAGEISSPYVIINNTGLDLMLKLDNAFAMPSDADNGRIKLLSGDVLPLSGKQKAALTRQASVIKATQDGEEKKMIFQIEQFNATREVTIKRAEKRQFLVNQQSGKDTWAVVCTTETRTGQKCVTFRSPIQVYNHLGRPVQVYYIDDSQRPVLLGEIQSDKTLDIPLHAVYTVSGSFRFKPIIDGYEKLSEEVKWRGAENFGSKHFSCQGQEPLPQFYFKVHAAVEEVYFEAGDTKAAKSTTFHLYPTVLIHNLLPVDINIIVGGTENSISLTKGSVIPLDNACVGKSTIEVLIPSYLEREWVGRREIMVDIPELSVWTFESYQGSNKVTMDMGLHFKKGKGSVDMKLYSPYWMINKTDMKLTYKAGDDEPVEHYPDTADVVLFSFKKSSGLGKKKASLKISEAGWSDKFSLDTVGSSGTVQSKTKTRTYEVGVKIVLSSSGLTKIVTLTPYYMLVNSSDDPIVCKEVSAESVWIDVPPKQCIPFWPLQTSKEMVMQAKFKETEICTGHFTFNCSHTTLMRLDNEFGGLNVECQQTEAAMVTTMTRYKTGMAGVLIINHTDRCPVSFNQTEVKTVHLLNPEMCQLYSWENSLLKRELCWTCGDKKDEKNDLSKDGINDFFFDSDTKVYWVSFLNGMQRVLLFTHDLAIATMAQEAGELERIEQEINLSISELGLSLVNNYKMTEVAYLGISSSGIIWEEKRKRFKALNLKSCKALETAYIKYQNEIAYGRTPPEKMHVEKMEVNFRDMLMTKPNKRQIRRSFQDGIWIQYNTSPHQVQFHAKFNRLQLDNQGTGVVFPTVFSPIPLSKSIAAESVPKPFTEVSMMMRKHEHSNISQIKYFKVLIQEMQVKVDQGFLNNLLELFSADQEVSPEQGKEQFDEDMKIITWDLMTATGVSLAVEQKAFYDYLHLSPIKIHLSFSLQGGDGNGQSVQIQANVINVFLQSVGVVLTDIQDVVFKLGYFERNNSFYNNSQLTKQMTMHYAGQAIKQMYVLVLGLDVLGNPFGLLRGMAEGMGDLFYEPYQGAIQGPEEFAEGLALGVRSLFGHAVGGAAGAVSRITGTLGKGIAALTLDDDYQKKRRENMNKRPANVGEGFARGGKGLVMGVFDGVTGIVRKPIEGAQKEGVGGFFKGVGKGLVGVVTRPTSGVIDFASSSFEGIKRITDFSSEIHRLRPPRRFQKDGIVRPYNLKEAEGFAVLQETDKGRLLKTDEYVAHVVVTNDGKNVLLVTTKRLVFSSRGDIFGQRDIEWTHTWNELKEKPKVTPKGIEVVLKEKQKKFFGSGTAKKVVFVPDHQQAESLVSKIAVAMDAAL